MCCCIVICSIWSALGAQIHIISGKLWSPPMPIIWHDLPSGIISGQISSHTANMFVYENYCVIWLGWEALTVSVLDTLSPWGEAGYGMGWELALCASVYMKARITSKALVQIVGLFCTKHTDIKAKCMYNTSTFPLSHSFLASVSFLPFTSLFMLTFLLKCSVVGIAKTADVSGG